MDMEKIKDKEKELENEENKLNNQVADESIFNHFKEEFEILKEVEGEVDELYREVKSHYDAMINNRQSGSLNFLQSQTANLVSLKTTKLNVVKERINLKKNIIDFGYKKSLHDNSNSSDSAIASELMKQLIEYESNNKITVKDEEVGIVGDNLEKVVEQYEKEGKIEYSESEKDPNAELNVDEVIRKLIAEEENRRDSDNDDDFTKAVTPEPEPIHEELEEELPDGLECEEEYYCEEDGITIAVGISSDRQQWDFIAISSDGELIDNYPDLPDSDCVDIKILRRNGELVALVSDGSMYPAHIVEFD